MILPLPFSSQGSFTSDLGGLEFLYNFAVVQNPAVCSPAVTETAVDSPSKTFLTFSWHVCEKTLSSGVNPENEKTIHLLNTEIGASLVPPKGPL